ncbi:MAG: hypothetical protein HYV63_29205 [Candidatus Schekmanbacteria bacterium]|nr:hypothetical protein [Candidatus Schekmanbacteria bacterium]
MGQSEQRQVSKKSISWATYAKLVGAAAAAAFLGTLAALAVWQAISERRAAMLVTETERRAKEELLSPAGRQRAAVRQLMFDPESASFRNEHSSSNKPLFWCGEVNGRNRMGGMVGFRRYVVELQKEADLSALDEAHLQPSSESKTSDEHVRFTAYWYGYCLAQ